MTSTTKVSGMHIFLVMWKAFRAIESVDRKSISGLGLGGHSEFAILEVLLHKGPLPINAIGRKVGLTSGSITTAVDRAAAKNWVYRTWDPDDRRVVRIALTSEGRRLIESKMPEHASKLETIAEPLTGEERETLLQLLKKVGKHAESLRT